MNLLSLLLSAYLSSQSLGSLSNNTGVQQSQLKKLLILALPLLIKYMTSNSQSQSGLSSLFGALGQHQSRSSVSDQIESADVEDGGKIIGHILGDDESDVLKSLSSETGLDIGDIANNKLFALFSENTNFQRATCFTSIKSCLIIPEFSIFLPNTLRVTGI